MSTGQIKHTSKNCNTKTQQTKTAGNAVMFDFCLLIINCLGFASSHRCLSQRGWVLCVVQEEGLGHRCTIWGLFHTIGSTTGIYRQKKKGKLFQLFTYPDSIWSDTPHEQNSLHSENNDCSYILNYMWLTNECKTLSFTHWTLNVI